jgi:2'-hydroxyisoflavone reductase
MKLLIIGGTRFIGPHLVASALANGAEVTVFNRGQEVSRPLADVETVYGDRRVDLNRLAGRHWDAVVDTCGFLPRTVRAAAQFFSEAVDRYVFVSSQSVYADVSVVGVDESSTTKTLTDEQLEKADQIDSSAQTSAFTYGDLYGGLKALSEQAVADAMPGRGVLVRPGLIVGPDDYTDRFTYWVMRVARGGEVLAPGRPDRFVQFIDVRDLAELIIKMIEGGASGVYNVNGPAATTTMESVLETAKSVSGSDASFTWLSESFLQQEGVAAWSELPLWLGEDSRPQLKGFMFASTARAQNAGLTIRPLADTIRDTLAWYRSNRIDEELRAGMNSDREELLLRKWHDSN